METNAIVTVFVNKKRTKKFREKNRRFVVTECVKTCDELVIGIDKTMDMEKTDETLKKRIKFWVEIFEKLINQRGQCHLHIHTKSFKNRYKLPVQ